MSSPSYNYDADRYGWDPVPDDDISRDEWLAYYADLDQMPVDLPSPDEIVAMARHYGADDVPF